MCVEIKKLCKSFPLAGNSYRALYALIQRASSTTYARRCISLSQMFVVEKEKCRQGCQLLFENLNKGYSLSLSLSL